MIRALFLLLAMFMAASPALAVNPDEILSDPKLEARARALSANLRCMVCQNQSIDDSNAELARDLRVLVRDRLVRGDTDEQVIDYAVRIVAATRKWPGISLGAGPRGSIALVRAARAQAVLQGRDFVTPDDVRDIAKPALRHRITLSPELQIEGQSPDDALHALLAKVEAPRK